jgi:hypothetical protein
MTDRDDEDDDVWPPDDDCLPALWAEGWRPMNHPPHNEEVEAHIRRCFGHAPNVLHEPLSKHVHIDIDIIPPSHGRSFTTYVTSGMSDLPMPAPERVPRLRWAELVIALPGPPEAHLMPDGREHYLISQMRQHARYPHAENAWLFFRHTIAADEHASPIGPDTAMCGKLLAMPLAVPIVEARDAFGADLSTGETVHFCALVPLHADELAFAREHGSDLMMDRLYDAGVTEIYDPARPSVLARRKRGFDWKRLLGRPM